MSGANAKLSGVPFVAEANGRASDLNTRVRTLSGVGGLLSQGGDGYPDVSARVTLRESQDQVVADYIAAHSPISPVIQGRINCVTGGVPACPVVVP